MAPSQVTRFVAVGDWFECSRMTDETRARPGIADFMAMLRDGDIAFLNLETNLATRGVPQEKQNVVRANPNVVEDLAFAGIDIVTLANNHMMDYSWAGVEDTIGFLTAAGIKQVGAGTDIEAARAPVIFEGPGGKIGFLAFSSVLSQSYAAGVARPGISGVRVTTAYVVEQPLAMEQPGSPPPVITMARDIDVQAMQNAVRALKKRADFVVVSAHWGVPGDELADYQREVGQALVDAGADMVVGHHPHRLQAVEFYKGKPIFHSISNFMFGPPPEGSNHPENSFRNRQTVERVYGFFSGETVLLEAQISGDRIERLALHPGLIGRDGYPELRRDMADHYVGVMQRLSKGLGAAFQAEDGRIIVSPA